MPNSKHIPECPFYEYEKARFIKCEDCKRSFTKDSDKDKWMDMYCDSGWKSCMYAKELTQMYEEGGDMEGHKLKVLQSEYRKIERRLTAAEKRNEAKDEEIKKLRRINKYLHKDREERIKLENTIADNEDKVAKELEQMGQMYEARFAYLMAEFNNGIMNEADAEEWAKDKKYAVIADKVEDGKVIQWRVVVRLDDSDDDSSCAEDKEKQSKDSAGERKTEDHTE